MSIFNRFATAGIKPDLTFIVDVDVVKGRQRGTCSDRMETEEEGYHQRVREGYLRLARRSKKRVRVLDGGKTIDVLAHEVVQHVQALLTRKGYTL
jgi:dTMP kinase